MTNIFICAVFAPICHVPGGTEAKPKTTMPPGVLDKLAMDMLKIKIR